MNVDGLAFIWFVNHLIVEIWFEYDRSSLVNQINAFNQFLADSRPECDADRYQDTAQNAPFTVNGVEIQIPGANR